MIYQINRSFSRLCALTWERSVDFHLLHEVYLSFLGEISLPPIWLHSQSKKFSVEPLGFHNATNVLHYRHANLWESWWFPGPLSEYDMFEHVKVASGGSKRSRRFSRSWLLFPWFFSAHFHSFPKNTGRRCVSLLRNEIFIQKLWRTILVIELAEKSISQTWTAWLIQWLSINFIDLSLPYGWLKLWSFIRRIILLCEPFLLSE